VGQPERVERVERVERIVLCSGKVAVDLAAARDDGVGARQASPAAGEARVAIARVEQLYPFPAGELRQTFARYPNLREIVWVQEEPRNMGAWSYIEPRLSQHVPSGVMLAYIGRPERAATAEGYPEVHAAEQARIVAAALALGSTLPDERVARDTGLIETRGTADVR
jgi:2-oxoglutarate dehydrogenase E1 component